MRDPFGVRIGRAPGQVHATTGNFDEEQHIQPLQSDRIDGKEINSDHTRRLRAQELALGGTPPLTRRATLFLTQDGLHGGR